MNQNNHGHNNHAAQGLGAAQYNRQGTVGTSNLNTFKINELRDLSKQKHQEDLKPVHGNS